MQTSSAWNFRLLWLLLLIGANCLLLGIAEEFFHSARHGTRWTIIIKTQILGSVVEGVLTAQMLLLGWWGALGVERLPVRMLIVIGVTAALFAICLVYYATITEGFDSEFFPYELGRFAALAVITWLLLRALRPWLGWRISWNESSPQASSRRFRILDLLAWTAAIAFPLGMMRTAFADHSFRFLKDTLAAFAFALPVAVPCLLWARGEGRERRKWLWLAAGALFLVSLWPAVFGGYLFPGTIPLMMLSTSIYYLVMLVTLLGNVLWMERLGLRIRRPVTRIVSTCGPSICVPE